MTRQPDNTDKTITIMRSARTVSGLTLISRVLGLIRDMLSAAMFGLSTAWDAFTMAFMIPNLLRKLFGEGALAASFIPVFTDYLEKGARERAWNVANRVLSTLLILLAAITLAGSLCCFILQKFSLLPARFSEILVLSQIMLPYMIFICITSLFAAMLQSLDDFFSAAIPPILLNCVWILALIVLCPWAGSQPAVRLRTLSVAILLAGIMQAGFLLPRLIRHGYHPKFTLHQEDEGARRILANMLPMLLGLSVLQLNLMLDQVIALTLVEESGAVSALYFGNRLFQLPLALVGLALATAAFPAFVRMHARGDAREFSRAINHTIAMGIFLGIPAGLGLACISQPLAGLLFERQAFGAGDTIRTSYVMACYGLGLWANCSNQILIRGFYAKGDTITPVKISAGMVACNLTLNLMLVFVLQEAGIALATAITAIVNYFILYGKLLETRDAKTLNRLVKTACTSCITGLGMAVFLRFLSGYISRLFFLGTAWKLLGVFILVYLGILLFVGGAALFRIPELIRILQILKPDART